MQLAAILPFSRFIISGNTPTMSVYDEQSALNGLQNLDSQAIAAIYDRYFTEVYRYVRYRIEDDAAAEDIASDVFIRLLEAVQKRQGPQSSLRGWLLATASNAINDHLRRLYRRPADPLSDLLPDPASIVHDEVIQREQYRAVRSAYAQLTDEQQHVLALRFGQGYSLEETAQVMKKKVNAVKALQFRALSALQRLIGEAKDE
ncbi:MAG: sigma-70 family RNA polymerase sigma factor [Anaerolineales bacterium]